MGLHDGASRRTRLLASSPLRVAAAAFLAWHDVDEEIEHIVFRESGAMSLRCRVRRLLSSACIQARIVSSVIKMSHPWAKKNRCCGDHFYLWIGFHDFLNACKG